MATDSRKLQLETEVDTSGARKGFNELKTQARDAAQSVSESAKKASDSVKGIGDGAQGAGAKFERETRSMIASVERATAALSAGERGTAKYFETLGKQRGLDANALKPYLDQLRQAEAAQQASVGTLGKMEVSARQTAAALRGVPAQFTDIVTSLQGGQQPLTVFLQQGGQLKDMFGGAGAAARALGGYVLGLVNPLSLAVAGAAALAVAYNQGSKEADAYRASIILTGNAAGVTAGQLKGMAERVSAQSGTQAKAAETLAAFVSTAQIGATNLERFSRIAIDFERTTGQAISETAKQFVSLAEAPAQASAKLNERYNYLTAAVYEQIKALEEQGRITDAARVAQEAYANALDTRATQIRQNLGYIEGAWRSITGAAKSAWDAMLNVGRASTAEDQLATLRKRLEDAQRERSMSGAAGQEGIDRGIEKLKQQIGLLQEQERLMRRGADAAAARAEATRLAVEWDKQGEQFKTKEAKRDEEIRRAEIEGQRLIADGLRTEEQVRQRIADIRKKYEDKGAISKDNSQQAELAALRARIEAEKEYTARLRDRGVLADKLTDGERQAKKLQEELTGKLDSRTRAHKEQLLAETQQLILAEKSRVAEEERAKAIAKSEENLRKQTDAVLSSAHNIEEQRQQVEAATAAYGKGATAIAQMKLELLELRLNEAGDSSQFAESYVAALRKAFEEQKRLVAALKKQDFTGADRGLDEALRQSQAQNALIREEIGLIGLTEQERRKIIAVREVELKLAKDIAEIDKMSIEEEDKEALRIKRRAQARIDAETAAGKVIVDTWQRDADRISDALTDGLMRGFENGESLARNLAKTTENLFKTMVLRPVIQAVFQPVAQGLSSLISGGISSLGLSALGSSIGKSLGLGSIFGGGASVGAGAGVSGALFGTGGGATAIAESAGALEAGALVEGVGGTPGLLGSVGPLGWVALGALALSALAGKGETRAGGQYGYSFDGTSALNPRRGTSVNASGVGALFLEGPSGGDPNQAAALAGINSTVDGINSMFKAFGLDTRVSGFAASYETSGKDRGGVFAGGTLSNGLTFGESGKGDNYAGTLFENTSTRSPDDKTAFANFMADLASTPIQALRALAGFGVATERVKVGTQMTQVSGGSGAEGGFDWIVEDVFEDVKVSQNAADRAAAELASGLPKVILDLVRDFDPEKATNEQVAAKTAELQKIVTDVETFRAAAVRLPMAELAGATFDAANNLIQLTGGIESWSAKQASYVQNFFSEEERTAQITKNITADLAAVGLTLPTTRDGFRALVEAQDLTTESGQKAYAALMNTADAFASITVSAEETAAALERQRQAEIQAAYGALERAAAADKAVLNARRDVLADSIGERQSLGSLLADNERSLRGEVSVSVARDAERGSAFIRDALATARSAGYLPDEADLRNAIDAARGGMGEGAFASQFEADRARLVLAGQLRELGQINGDALTIDEKQLELVEQQTEALEATLDYWKRQIELAEGGIGATLTVVETVKTLQDKFFPTANAAPSGGGATPGGAVFGGTMGSSPQIGFTIDANGFRRYDDGSGGMLTEGELDLWRRGLLGKVVPQFARGGYHSGGVALLGEEGPELVDFSRPARIYNAAQSREFLRSPDQGGLESEVRALREQVALLTEAAQASAADVHQLAEQFDQVTEGGNAVRSEIMNKVAVAT